MTNPLIIIIILIAIIVIAYILIKRVCNKNIIGGMLTPFITNNRIIEIRGQDGKHYDKTGVCGWIENFNIIGSNVELCNQYVMNTIKLPFNIFTIADKKDIGKRLNKDQLLYLVKNWTDPKNELYLDDLQNVKVLFGRCYQLALWSGHTLYEDNKLLEKHDPLFNKALDDTILSMSNDINIYSIVLNAFFVYIKSTAHTVISSIMRPITIYSSRKAKDTIKYSLIREYPDLVQRFKIGMANSLDFNTDSHVAYCKFIVKLKQRGAKIDHIYAQGYYPVSEYGDILSKHYHIDITQEEIQNIISELPEMSDEEFYTNELVKDAIANDLHDDDYRRITALTYDLLHTVYVYQDNYFILTHISLSMYELENNPYIGYYIGDYIYHATYYDVFRESICSNGESYYVTHEILCAKSINDYSKFDIPAVYSSENNKKIIFMPSGFIYSTFPRELIDETFLKHYRIVDLFRCDVLHPLYNIRECKLCDNAEIPTMDETEFTYQNMLLRREILRVYSTSNKLHELVKRRVVRNLKYMDVIIERNEKKGSSHDIILREVNANRGRYNVHNTREIMGELDTFPQSIHTQHKNIPAAPLPPSSQVNPIKPPTINIDSIKPPSIPPPINTNSIKASPINTNPIKPPPINIDSIKPPTIPSPTNNRSFTPSSTMSPPNLLKLIQQHPELANKRSFTYTIPPP